MVLAALGDFGLQGAEVEGLVTVALDPFVAQDGPFAHPNLDHGAAQVGARPVVFLHQFQLRAPFQHHQHPREDGEGSDRVRDEEQVQGQRHLHVLGHQEDGAVLEAGGVEVLEHSRIGAVLHASQAVAGFAGDGQGEESHAGRNRRGAAGMRGVVAVHEDLAGAHHFRQQMAADVRCGSGGGAEAELGQPLQVCVLPILLGGGGQVAAGESGLGGPAQFRPFSGPWRGEQVRDQAAGRGRSHRTPPAAASSSTQS